MYLGALFFLNVKDNVKHDVKDNVKHDVKDDVKDDPFKSVPFRLNKFKTLKFQVT